MAIPTTTTASSTARPSAGPGVSSPTRSTSPPASDAATAPELPADLVAGLRRLKLATVRAHAPQVLATAKVQRWTAKETLRVLVEAELAARDASDAAARLKAAAFPVIKTLKLFDVDASSIPAATLDYLATLGWSAPGRTWRCSGRRGPVRPTR